MDYSLSDLERLAGVTARTVRYYVAQGLLPSPGSGRTARYTDTHLARLRLIRRLQREHLPLAEIRRRLESMPDTAIALAADQPPAGGPAPAPPMDSAVDYVRRLLATPSVGGPVPPPMSAVAPPPGPPARSVPSFPSAAPSGPASTPSAPASTPPAAPSSPSAPASAAPSAPSAFEAAEADLDPPPAPDRSTWERIVLAPDVELHVRRPLDRPTAKQVDRLVRIGRELLADEA